MAKITTSSGMWLRTTTLKRTACRSLALSILVLPGLTVAEWNFYPVLRAGADLNDNATLTTRTDEGNDISGAVAEARLGMVYQDPTNMLSIEPFLRSRRYDGGAFLDSDDQFLNFRMRHKGQSGTLSARGNFSRESVRTAELADADLEGDFDPDEIEDDDTGLVNIRQTRDKIRIVPRWNYRFSNVSNVVAEANFVTVNYEDDGQPVLRLNDYTDIRARIKYERALSARNTGLLVATARNYQTSLNDGDFSGYGISAGFDRELTQTSTFRALVGVETTEQIDSADEDPRFVADISLIRRQETTRLLAQYRRRISAGGQGSFTERDEVNLRFTRELTDKLAAGIGARAYQSTRFGSLVENETQYVQLNAQVLWRITNAFSIQANYRHTVIDQSVVGESANSNRITIWFSYQPRTQSRLTLRN